MMFGEAPFASRPFAALQDIRFYLLGVGTIRITFEFAIYVATAEFATEPDDTPGNQPFRGTLSNPLSNFRRSILGGNTIGIFASGDGQLVIDNTDAFYDFLIQIYSVDGREILVKVGQIGESYLDYFVIYKGTASGWAIDEDHVNINLRDNGYKLAVPAQLNVYGGTGTSDGGADLANKRKPRVFGPALNFSPPLVAPNLLIYQVNDGPINAVTAVYDRGVPLVFGSDRANYAALAAAVISAGNYDTCLAEGWIRLGGAPDGTITVDLEGDKTGGIYRTTSADIVRLLIASAPQITDPDDVYGASFAAVNVLQPAPIAFVLGPDDSSTVADCVASIMGGIGGWAGFRRDGRLEVGVFRAPSGAPLAIYDNDKGDILEIRREALPGTLSPPPWRWRVAHERNWTEQTDLADAVTAMHRSFVAAPYRLAVASSLTLKAERLLAQDPEPVLAYFAEEADATAEAARRLALYAVERAIYRMTVDRRRLTANLGDVIRVIFPRWDITVGRLMVVVEINENLGPPTDGAIDTIEIVAYG